MGSQGYRNGNQAEHKTADILAENKLHAAQKIAQQNKHAAFGEASHFEKLQCRTGRQNGAHGLYAKRRAVVPDHSHGQGQSHQRHQKAVG